jgi:hypothetical protein
MSLFLNSAPSRTVLYPVFVSVLQPKYIKRSENKNTECCLHRKTPIRINVSKDTIITQVGWPSFTPLLLAIGQTLPKIGSLVSFYEDDMLFSANDKYSFPALGK